MPVKRGLTSVPFLRITAMFFTCFQVGYPHAPETGCDTAQKVYNYVFG